LNFIYEDGDGYALVEADSAELALQVVYQRDLDSEDHEMMRVSPFTLTEVTFGAEHQLAFELTTPVTAALVVHQHTKKGKYES